MRNAISISIISILGVFLIGCGDENNDNASFNLHLEFAPSAIQQADITRVVVTITGFDIDTQEVELKVEGNRATGAIVVPAGEERHIAVKAYAGANIEFEGEADIDHPKPGQQIEVKIQLKPTSQPNSQIGGLAVDFKSWQNGRQAPPWCVGFEFQVTKSVKVGSLCVWDDMASPGFAQDQQVGLWKSDGTLITSVFVISSDPTTGGGTGGKWRYHSITPIDLIPNTNYIVASQGAEPMVYWPENPIWDSRVTYIKNRYSEDVSGRNTPLRFPSNTDSPGWGDPGYFGGNFIITE